MMEDLQDFIDQFFTPEKPIRDDAGRPLLIPAGEDIEDANRVPYSRASSLADHLEDFSFLWKWKMRGLAKGLADRPDLARLVASETYTTGFAADESANRAAGRRIDEVIERALDHAGTAQKADYGTAIHSRTEPGSQGIDIDEQQRLDVESCWTLWRDLDVVHLGTEIFTANDFVRTAGTFDHLSYVPGYGIVVTDKKTSAKAKQNYDIQLAVYANADVYEVDTDNRVTLEEYVEAAGWDPTWLNRQYGIIWWVKNGRTEPRVLDLEEGWRWAKLAAEVRDQRRPQAGRVAKNVRAEIDYAAVAGREGLMDRIGASETVYQLYALWNDPSCRAHWGEMHTEAAKHKRSEL